MSEAITRAERHARRESAMEPGVGYCRECKRSWPCLYEQGQRDEREACAQAVEARGGYHSASEFAAAIRARGEKP